MSQPFSAADTAPRIGRWVWCTAAVSALVVLDRYLRQPVPIGSSGAWVSAALIAASYFMKPTGILALGGGWLLALHPRFRSSSVIKKMLLCTALTAVPVAAWKAWCASVPDVWFWTQSFSVNFLRQDPFNPASPALSLAGWLLRVKQNVTWGMAAHVGTLMVAPLAFHPGSLTACLLGASVAAYIIGMSVRSFLREPSVLEGFTWAGLGLLAMAHAGHAERYMAVLYPSLAVYAIRGLGLHLGPRRMIWTLSAVIAVSLTTTAVIASDQARNPYGAPVAWDYMEIAGEAKKRFATSSTCVAPLTTHWQLVTGHACFSRYEQRSLPGDAVPDYLVMSRADTLDGVPETNDVYEDLHRRAFRIKAWLARQAVAYETVYVNKTLAIVKVAP